MAGISSVSSYSSFLNNYNRTGNLWSSTGRVSSTEPQLYKLDNLFSSVKSLTSLSRQNIQFAQEQYRYQITSFRGAVQDLSASVKQFTGTNNIFNKKFVSSSSSAVSGEAKASAKAVQYDIGVSKLATTQKNKSSNVNGNSLVALATGTYTIGVKVGAEEEKRISFSVSVTDDNKKVLSKIAAALNNGEKGLAASVEQDGALSGLKIESKETGAANNFSIVDIEGDAVQKLNLGNKVQDAGDAQYTVDGKVYNSAANTVGLDDGNVALKLNAVTTEPAKVTVGADNGKTVSAVRNLVNAYNDFSDLLQDSGNLTGKGTSLLSGINASMNKVKGAEFQNIGLDFDSKTGQLSLDEGKLAKALENNLSKVKDLLSVSRGLGGQLDRWSKAIDENPVSNYLKPPSALEYLDYGARQTAKNNFFFESQNFGRGLFLDMLV